MDVVVVYSSITNISNFLPLSTTLPHFFTFSGNYSHKTSYFGVNRMGFELFEHEHFRANACFQLLTLRSMRFLPAIFLLIMACSGQEKTGIPTGTWRATLELQGQKLPFTFDLEKEGEHYVAWIRNGQERLYLDEVEVTADSITMNVHIFDAVFKAAIREKQLEGLFIIQYADDYRVPFKARHGEKYRFAPTDTTATVTDFSGKYAVQFFNENSTVNALGIITQKGNYAEGTFLTLRETTGSRKETW